MLRDGLAAVEFSSKEGEEERDQPRLLRNGSISRNAYERNE